MKNPPKTQCTKVVVDVREFRSSLPNLLDMVRDPQPGRTHTSLSGTDD